MRAAVRSLLAALGALLIRALGATLRLRTVYPQGDLLAGRTPLFAFWHGRQLPLLCWDIPRGTTVLVSHSRDGALQAQVLSRLGLVPERGSSRRGGVGGLLALARRVRDGSPAAFAVDGGRGPLHSVHEGVLMLARVTGQPVVPLGASVRHRKVFERAWDRYLLPWPFSRAAVVVGEPLEVPARADRATLRALAEELGRRIHEVTAAADAACGAPSEPAAVGSEPCPRCAGQAPTVVL